MVVLGHGNGKSPGLAAESARPGGVGGASDGSCKRKRFLEGRGGRAGQPAAQPVVGWKARELPEAERDVWSGPKTTSAPIDSSSCPATDGPPSSRTGGKTGTDLREKVWQPAGCGDGERNACAFSFAFWSVGD